jgi:hypothetical protein
MATRPVFSAADVAAILRAARPSIVIRPEITSALKRLERATS